MAITPVQASEAADGEIEHRARGVGPVAAEAVVGVAIASVVVVFEGSFMGIDCLTQRWIEDQGSRRNAMSLIQTRTSRSKIIATLLSPLILLASCRKQEVPHEKTQNTFAAPDEAAKALVAAAKSGNGDAVLEIFEPGAKDILSSGDAAKDRADLAGFVSDYDSMHRLRKLQNESCC